MVQERLEDGKIAKILVGQGVFERADFLGHISLAFEAVHHVTADLPVKVLNLRLLRQVHHAQGEHVLRIFAALEDDSDYAACLIPESEET